MKNRLVLLPVAVLLAVGTSAYAAPAKVACNTIEDPAGDTFLVRSQDAPPVGPRYGPQEDSLDVISGDLASDGKVVTAVVRIKKLSRSIALSPTGITVGVDFLIGTSTDVIRLMAVLANGQPDKFEVTWKAEGHTANVPVNYLGEVTGVVDEAKNEVRIHAPVDLLAPHGVAKIGAKLIPNEAESATAARAVPQGTKQKDGPTSTRGPFADIAVGGKSVVVGAKSCVVPGK
ncbi:MAG TPA: hypothetical protein VNA14_07950 [Mycobacteriales bacterium]|nr:hypothetical protein [Mycobacteriales bacterium]